MSGHTPGPWRVTPSTNIVGRDGQPVFDCAPENIMCGTWDARLIAAAPDLLAALVDMVRYEDLPASDQQPAVERARTAIAKARGKS